MAACESVRAGEDILATLIAGRLSPRMTFSRGVTGSRWLGFTHARLRHRWSIVSPSGRNRGIITEAMKTAFVKGSRCLRKPYADDQLRLSIQDMLAA